MNSTRSLALGILLIPLAGLCAIVLPICRHFSEERQSLREAIIHLTRARALASEHDALSASLHTLEARNIWQAVYPPGSAEAAGRQLQSDVRAALDKVTRESRLDAVKQERIGPITRLAVEARFQTTADGLREVLARIASPPRRLDIMRLSVLSPVTQATGRNEFLDVDIDVVGYLASETGRPGI